ncbi:MAG: hypothetical protein IJI41_01215 [Anaerolineaceae bacterium]|nr:hypothetical protein [Anaerolineaceae bacterium]
MAEIYDKVVGVRFSSVNKAYFFDANGFDLDLDDYVIVDSVRGRQIGKVVQVKTDYLNEGEPLKTVLRPASSKDLVARELFNQKKDEAITYARKRLEELGLDSVKILDAEFSFDGSRLQVNYASDNDEKVDLKSLKFDLLRYFPNVNQVDLRQLGPRDVAKSIPGMGACGLACRCCCRYLTEFSSISIKMAKEQGISLTPAEITGMCGRLRCCLVYENDFYVECRKKLPKKNKRVMTPQGEGKVVEVFPLRDSVLVEIPEVGRREFKREQINTDDVNQDVKNKKERVPEEDDGIDDNDILALVSGKEQVDEPEAEEKSSENPPIRNEKKDRVDRREKRDRKPGNERGERVEKQLRFDRPQKYGKGPRRANPDKVQKAEPSE